MTTPGAGAQRPVTSRPHFTGRAAVLGVVICAIALSLAYPVREYLAQRRQIDLLLAQRGQLDAHLRHLAREQARLKSRPFIEEQARDRLHLCLPTEMCYVVIDPVVKSTSNAAARQAATPWYSRLWSSVRLADAQPKRPDRSKAGGHKSGSVRHRAGSGHAKAGRGNGRSTSGAGARAG